MRDKTLDLLAELDNELTAHSMDECMRRSRDYKNLDIFELATNLYYLSDCGLSRLRITDKYEIGLAMGARAEVQFNWLYADKKIAAVNLALAQELKDVDAQLRSTCAL